MDDRERMPVEARLGELTSVALILDDYASEEVEKIALPRIEGLEAFAFAFEFVLRARGPLVHELGMDSTCKFYSAGSIQPAGLLAEPSVFSGKTNALGFELHAFVAEANGLALPLAFMFVKTGLSTTADPKRTVIASCIERIRISCPNIEFTLSNKDQSEISAIRRVLPETRHQLCYRHVMKYLGNRLMRGPRTPYVPRSGRPGGRSSQERNRSVRWTME